MLATCRSVGQFTLTAAIVVSALVVWPAGASAENGRATEMWGTGDSSSSANQYRRSAEFHATSGVSAGQVNAARRGVLYSGPNMTVVGSQTIVQVTGNNNVVRDIDQSAVNSGDQSLEAPID